MRKPSKMIPIIAGALLGIYLGFLIMSKTHGISWVEAATGTYLSLPPTELLCRWIMAISAIGIWACVGAVAYFAIKIKR